ncbi:MAG TPA: glycosyltransferase family 4 protein [Thermoplasmatales archaeon]|nr:glycosyltransferase family 4 protein [Thermoplasmatales archaeon]
MKIAWFTDTWIPNRDGVVTSLMLFKKVLEENGHTVYIFAPGKRNERKGNVIYYRARTFAPYPDYRFPSFLSIFTTRTRKMVEEIQPDILHSHSPGMMGIHAVVASHKCGIPLVFTYHTFVDESVYLLFKNEKMQHLAKQLFYVWLRWYFRRCSCVIAPSRYVAQRIAALCEKEVHVVPTGIEVEAFEGGNGKRVRERYGSKKIILHVGRMVKEKNIDLLIEAAPHVLEREDAVFILTGKGPAKDYFEQQVRERGLDEYFVFTGFVSDGELLDYYRAADVFAFPSTYETQGIVALEAMAAGVPVVAARAKALPEFIRDGENGYLASPTDAREFAEKIIAAMNDEDVGERAREFVAQYHIKKMAERLVEVYEKCR